MIVKLLTEHQLEFLGLKGGYTGSSESTLVKMSYCWKSHAVAHLSNSVSVCLLQVWLGRMVSTIFPHFPARKLDSKGVSRDAALVNS